MKLYLVFLLFMGVMSLISFVLYGADKQKAKRGEWRTSELVLLLFGFCGGAVGALLGMEAFRHKTKHWYFWAVNLLGLVLQIVITVLLFSKA